MLLIPSAVWGQADALDLFRLGAQELTAGLVDKAIESFEKGVEKKPDAKEGWYNLGVAYGRKKMYPKEVQAYQKALELDPNYTNALHNLGLSYLDQGLKDKGVESLQKAVSIDGTAADSWNNLGVAFLDLGRIPESVQAFRKGTELTPESPEAWFNLGVSLLKAAEKEANTARAEPILREALAASDATLKFNPKAWRAAYNRGVIFHRLGDAASEITAYQQALTLRPDYPAALYNLAAALSIKGERDAAVDIWEAFVKVARGDPAERTFVETARKEITRLKEL
jgi:superkiller protein 3